jgi:hypothetical protein
MDELSRLGEALSVIASSRLPADTTISAGYLEIASRLTFARHERADLLILRFECNRPGARCIVAGCQLSLSPGYSTVGVTVAECDNVPEVPVTVTS